MEIDERNFSERKPNAKREFYASFKWFYDYVVLRKGFWILEFAVRNWFVNLPEYLEFMNNLPRVNLKISLAKLPNDYHIIFTSNPPMQT